PANTRSTPGIPRRRLAPGVDRFADLGLTLQPPTNRRLVGRVLGWEVFLQIALFSRDDDERDESDGRNQRNQQGETVDPKGQPELEKREREVDRVPGEAVGPHTDDRRRGPVPGNWRASCPEGANCGDKEGDGQQCDSCADRGAERRGNERR